MLKTVTDFETSYQRDGFAACSADIRNEELVRFVSRCEPIEVRGLRKFLDLGCGAGANLWMLAREGFDAYGIDSSPTALNLAYCIVGELWRQGDARCRRNDGTTVPKRNLSLCLRHLLYLLFADARVENVPQGSLSRAAAGRAVLLPIYAIRKLQTHGFGIIRRRTWTSVRWTASSGRHRLMPARLIRSGSRRSRSIEPC